MTDDQTVRYVIHEEDGQWWSESNGLFESRFGAADTIYELLRLISEHHSNDWRRICPECNDEYSDWEGHDNCGVSMQGGYWVCSGECGYRRARRLKIAVPGEENLFA